MAITQSLKAAVTDGSATIPDYGYATNETEFDAGESKVEGVDSSLPTQLHSSLFQEGERVLAFHSQLLYEAKVLKVKLEGDWSYFVHYCGWSKNWDEWVGVDRLLKLTEENIQKQEELEKQGMQKNIMTGRSPHLKAKGGRGRKRKSDTVQEDERAHPSEKPTGIQIPPILKKQLVDDSNFVTRLGKLVKLPRSPNVDEILIQYNDYRLKKEGMIADCVEEIVNGVRCYFDKALPAKLLYNNERQQYQEAIADGVSPSSVYGAEHLLRLFVVLPGMLQDANIEDHQTLMELQQNLQDFLMFLQRNQSAFFLSTYQTPGGVDETSESEG